MADEEQKQIQITDHEVSILSQLNDSIKTLQTQLTVAIAMAMAARGIAKFNINSITNNVITFTE